MAKDNKYKLSDHDEEMIKNFRQRAEQNANSLINANGFEFIEENRDYTYRLTVMVHFALFDLRVYYYPVLFPETEYSDYIDFSLKFPASEYRFSIYDIFNYLDIEDFNLYYYNRCYAKSSVDSAVDNIFAVCQKYMADIDYIAKRNDAVAKLEKQCDADEYITDDFESDDYTPDDEDMIDDLESITLLRPVSYISKQKTVIKNLRKNEEKGLNSLYESRLLKYLEAGNSLPLNSSGKNTKSNKKYLKAEIISDVIIFVISLVFAFAVIIIIQRINFSGAYMPIDGFSDFLGISVVQCGNAGLAGLFFSFAVLFSFGEKIISCFVPKEDKKSFSLKYITEVFGIKSKKKAKAISVIVAVVFAVFGFLVISMSISNIGFYDDYVKCIPDNKSSFCEISYDNLEIYNIALYYDEDSDTAYDDNAYAIADKQHTVYCELGSFAELGEFEKFLFKICDEYEIEIQQIDTMKDLSEICGEVVE